MSSLSVQCSKDHRQEGLLSCKNFFAKAKTIDKSLLVGTLAVGCFLGIAAGVVYAFTYKAANRLFERRSSADRSITSHPSPLSASDIPNKSEVNNHAAKCDHAAIPVLIGNTHSSRGLESELPEATQAVDVHADCGFRDYLEPNEGTHRNVQPHLERMSEGLLVSTGTERSFFDLLFSPEDKCKGLVVRDINPRVKAYVDFLTLLLRISGSRDEFVLLSATPSKEDFQARINQIRSKIQTTSMPEEMARYYLLHLDDFAKVYFGVHNRLPPAGDNFGIDYRSDDSLFEKLQKYAKSGNIVATIGDIGDLEFLGHRKVSVVDTSNILDYTMLDFRGRGAFNPRIIYTYQDSQITHFYSYILAGLNEAERSELERLIDIVKDAHSVEKDISLHLENLATHEKLIHGVKNDPFNDEIVADYSLNALDFLRKYTADFIFIEGLGYLDIKNCLRFSNKYQKFSEMQIDSLIMHKDIMHYIEYLFDAWVLIDPNIYIALMKVEGWKSHFEKKFSEKFVGLSRFLNKLKKHGLLPQFKRGYGEDNLRDLLIKLKEDPVILYCGGAAGC